MKRNFQVIILDFDGVLVPSNEIKTGAFRTVFSEFPKHVETMMQFHQENVSISRVEKFCHLIRVCLGRKDDPVLLDRLLKSFSREVSGKIAACSATQGSIEFLEEFSSRIPLYLTSVTPMEELSWILEKRRLKKYFRDFFGDPPVSKKGAVRMVAEQEGCPASEMVLVGDSLGDWQAACDAGTAFIGYDSGLPLPVEAVKFSDWASIGDYLRPAEAVAS